MAKSAVKPGDTAPDFTLPDETGAPVRLYDLLDASPVMLVFYPGDFTPVCTKQLCSYRDRWADFQRFDLSILGISDDPVDKHASFRSAKSLPFPLLSDPTKHTIKRYSGSGLLSGGRANRANYIIGQDRVVRYAHVETVALTRRKPGELLDALEDLTRRGVLQAT